LGASARGMDSSYPRRMHAIRIVDLAQDSQFDEDFLEVPHVGEEIMFVEEDGVFVAPVLRVVHESSRSMKVTRVYVGARTREK